MKAKDLRQLFEVGEKEVYCPRHTPATEVWHPCERRLVLMRQVPLPIKQAKKYFDVGSEFEEVALKRLLKIVPVKAYQLPVISEELDVKGVVDVILESGDFIEIKSTASENILDDFGIYESNKLTKKYYYQMQTYMLLLQRDYGIFYVIDRRTGEDYFFDVERDEAVIEEIKERAIHVKEHIQKGTLPKPIEQHDLCRACPFFDRCYPEETKTTIRTVEVSPEFMKKLEIYYAIKAKLKQYEQLEKEIKEELKNWDAGTYRIGDKIIKITEYQRAFYNIPEEIKKQYVEYRPVKRIWL
ncbi:TPA: PD-(D/E)XK nuclease [Aquificae Conch Spring virus]|nr:TPA: PD-(D/E)XK nuclease [Aquificae Conch Spring virus]